jgi:hypothetical protein
MGFQYESLCITGAAGWLGKNFLYSLKKSEEPFGSFNSVLHEIRALVQTKEEGRELVK